MHDSAIACISIVRCAQNFHGVFVQKNESLQAVSCIAQKSHPWKRDGLSVCNQKNRENQSSNSGVEKYVFVQKNESLQAVSCIAQKSHPWKRDGLSVCNQKNRENQSSNSGVEKYRSAVSGRMVTTRLPGPSFLASWIAAATLVPEEIPHIKPSLRAKSLAV